MSRLFIFLLGLFFINTASAQSRYMDLHNSCDELEDELNRCQRVSSDEGYLAGCRCYQRAADLYESDCPERELVFWIEGDMKIIPRLHHRLKACEFRCATRRACGGSCLALNPPIGPYDEVLGWGYCTSQPSNPLDPELECHCEIVETIDSDLFSILGY